MSKNLISQIAMIVCLSIFLSRCSSVEKCTGEFAANSDWALFEGATWPEDISYCECQTEEIEVLDTPWRKGHFEHYTGNGPEDLKAAMEFWDSYLKERGYFYEPSLMPSNHVIQLEESSYGMQISPESDLDALIEANNFRTLAGSIPTMKKAFMSVFLSPGRKPSLKLQLTIHRPTRPLKKAMKQAFPASNLSSINLKP